MQSRVKRIVCTHRLLNPVEKIVRTAFLMIMYLTALAGCGSGGGELASALRPSSGNAVVNGRINADLVGAWKILGEGTLIEITDSGATRYHEATSVCFTVPSTASMELFADFTFHKSVDLHHITIDLFEVAGAPSAYTLERIKEIPPGCKLPPPQDPASTFKVMWEMLDQDYAFFKERHIDWQARYNALYPRAAQATSDDLLQPVLIDALTGFDDEHTALIRSRNGALSYEFIAAGTPTLSMLKRAFQAQSEVTNFFVFEILWKAVAQQQMLARLQGGSNGRVLDDKMVWGRLPGNVGYIEISSMGEFSASPATRTDLALIRQEMDRAIAALGDTKALILDVSLNGGGLDYVSTEIAGSFADRRRLGFTKRQHREQGRPTQSWYIEPKGAQQYLKPVYLLTSDRTVSAGETLTLMMRELPNVTHVGQSTSGSLSNALVKPLPGNFYVAFSNEIYLDPAGVSYEAKGIPPRIPLAIFEPSDLSTLYSGHGTAISNLLALIH